MITASFVFIRFKGWKYSTCLTRRYLDTSKLTIDHPRCSKLSSFFSLTTT